MKKSDTIGWAVTLFFGAYIALGVIAPAVESGNGNPFGGNTTEAAAEVGQ